MYKKEVDVMKTSILEIADLFYQNRIKEGTERLPELIKLLTEIVKMIDAQKQKGFAELLNYVTEAIESKEYVLLADILVFEVLEEI